ncbi:MAG TPA: cytochrome-c oxidase, cbb3-type subunit II [Kofleriaceae bacterium]|nr:cytochrome-c oxidase, cbb3-type subunit II [Kofleriaceae bacterium]
MAGPPAPTAPPAGAGVPDDRAARRFALAALAWGALAMAAGVFVGLELMVWQANAAPQLGFGRMRPVHTASVLFAFGGNLVFAGIYYSAPRLLRAPISRRLAAIHFWTWQLAAVAAVVSLPLGINQGGELAELEWPIDLALLGSWLVFAAQLVSMVRRRGERRIHPSIWFYAATVIGVAVFHLVASLALPVSLTRSYSLFGGMGDALIQAWAGQGLFTFLLVVPLFGLLYDLLPRAAGQPLHSRNLVLIHFWGFLFAIGWTGSLRLLDTAVPDWAQAAGAAFGLVLWAPGWAGVLNGLMTARAAASSVRGDPVLKFFVAALLFYGAAAIDGSILASRDAASLAHYTDWHIGQVHLVALGWAGLAAAGALYWMVPRMWGTRLHSPRAASVHFYLAVVGALFYVAAMAIAGPTQGLMLRAERPEGGLVYSFVESLRALHVTHGARLIGGVVYFAGFLVMGWNLIRTIRAAGGAGAVADSADRSPDHSTDDPTRLRDLLLGQPVLFAAGVLGLLVAAALAAPLASFGLVFFAAVVALGGLAASAALGDRSRPSWHERLETRGLALAILIAAALLSGGVAELAPLLARGPSPVPGESEPYSPLQLEGRDIYLAEGCRACHSQMIRPFLWEVARYGEVSSASESLYDHPAQWGSRRIGPDLARIGGRYPNLWHHDHLIDPRAVTLGSTMPSYRHLAGERVDLTATAGKMRALRALGVPYTDAQIDRAADAAAAEGRAIALDLRQTGKIEVASDSAIVALIAYLQRMGQPP